MHREDAGRLISASDVGRRVYALHLPAPLTDRPWEKSRYSDGAPNLAGLSMHLELRPGLAAARLASQLLSLVAVFGVLALLTKTDVRPFLVALALTTVALVIMATVVHFSEGKYLGPAYPPHGGGDDGLSHEFMGRTMAREFMSGNWTEVLRGGQSVYWDTPGMRYARFVEKTVFGDTNLGYAAFVGLLPWFVYLLIRQLAGVRWAGVGFLLFLLSPLGSLSYLQYIMNAKLGYAEAMALGFFVLGSYLFMRSQPGWTGERHGVFAFSGGVCLAGAMFLRPNLALAVPLLGALFALACWRSRDFRTMAASMAGLAFALWMPLHNYLYGHQFVLISLGATAVSVTLSPATYLQAAQAAVTGSFHAAQIAVVTKQLSEWLWTLPRLPISSLKPVAEGFMVVKLATLAVTVFAAFRYLRVGGPLPVLAWVAIAAHLPMLFVAGPGLFRYAMIGWDLSAIVTLAIVADYVRRLPPTSNSIAG